jgi:ubiquinone/menaquinone biosynthesis C-methylase UbiE
MGLRSRERPRFSSTRTRSFRHPNEDARNRVVYRQLEDALRYSARTYARGRLVDVGCGAKPWEPLFTPFVDEYLGVDIAESPNDLGKIDIYASAYEIPLPDQSADTVLLNEVLEHLERPAVALAEAHRLLRPGGHVIVDTPFSWPVHEPPRDFYRYSPYGLRFLLEEAGFEVVEVTPLAGAWTSLAVSWSYALQQYRRPGLAPVVDGLTTAVQWLAARWERVDFQPAFSWCHLAVGARRPAAAVDRVASLAVGAASLPR